MTDNVKMKVLLSYEPNPAIHPFQYEANGKRQPTKVLYTFVGFKVAEYKASGDYDLSYTGKNSDVTHLVMEREIGLAILDSNKEVIIDNVGEQIHDWDAGPAQQHHALANPKHFSYEMPVGYYAADSLGVGKRLREIREKEWRTVFTHDVVIRLADRGHA